MTARATEHHASLPSTVLGLGAAAIEGWSGYLTGLCRRRADVLDVATDFAEFWRVVTSRERPSWAHPNTVRWQRPLADLRDYALRGERAQVATLVLPPQSGRASSIVDYAAGRSLMLTLRESGLTNLYCLDWKPPGPSTVDASIEDYVALLSETVDSLGGRVNLVGYSQGGWLATIYTALYPDSVHTLVVAGAPIDFHAGRSQLLDWISPMFRRTEMASFRSIVAAVAALQRGISQAVGVPLGKPAGEFERAMGLLAHLDDPRFVERYLDLKRWFEWTEDMPAAFSDWIIQQLFVSNRLISGGLEVGGRAVMLDAITCPLVLIAGTADHITPPEQVWALERYVSTPPAQVSRRSVEAGHLGLLIGHAALEEHWLPVMRSVAERSALEPE